MVLNVAFAWYEHPLAIVALGFLILGAMALAMAWRTRKLTKAKEELERRVQERTLELEKAHLKLKESMEARLQFTSMVAHDMRSPLTAITLSTDRLSELLEGFPEHAKALKLIQGESHRLEGQLRRMLNHIRSEVMVESAVMRPCSADEALGGLVEVMQLKADASAIHFKLDRTSEDPGVEVFVDPTAIQQVLLNLFENALKFTPPLGTVGLRTQVPKDSQEWWVEVWDTGRGLDTAQREELMRPFAQAREADAMHGWGLGLNICKTLVDLHHGHIQVYSEPGEGTRFIVALPLLRLS